MYILSTKEMYNIDRRTIEEYDVPGEVLMENAGREVADKIDKYIDDYKGRKVLIVCGKGNNGGDGYVVARHMYEKGAFVYVLICAVRDEIKGDARIMLERLPDKVHVLSYGQAADMHFDLVVDAVFGTGFQGSVDGIIADVIDSINKWAPTVVAVDIPSGVNGNTGEIASKCVKADYTFTFCCEKLGHVIYPGKGMCGKVMVCNIGIPEQAVLDEKPMMRMFTELDMDNVLRPLAPTDHKGDNGKLLIIGGSPGMAGSVCLTAMAAMRAGVGLCYVAIPDSIYPIVATKLTEAMTVPLISGKDGCIAPSNAEKLEELLGKVDAVVVGCGMSVKSDTCEFLYKLFGKLKTPVLFDADALNILAKDIEKIYDCEVPVVMTPHMMEMSRLTGLPIKAVQGDKVGTAARFVDNTRVTLVLKGDGTVTMSNGTGYINTSGNPGMATGGSGDVLSGIIGAFMAGGMKPFKAAACGVFVHGMAGDMAAEKKSMRGMIASDIVENLPYCFTSMSVGKVSTYERKPTHKETGHIHRLV